ncbi:MAG TPA: hypothetical protein VGV18_04905 [Verrucomicrobiae bacterium]|nr:hypothetical protein [Verrucomicrobiae bacterium]
MKANQLENQNPAREWVNAIFGGFKASSVFKLSQEFAPGADIFCKAKDGRPEPRRVAG